MTEEAQSAIEAPQDAPVVEAVETPAVEAPTPAPPKEQTVSVKVMMDRVSRETARAQQEAERAVVAERRATEAEALAQRLQSAQGGEKLSPGAPTHIPQDEGARRADIQREAAAQRFYEDTLEVRNKGVAQFGQSFGETLRVLGALGATENEFIADVLAIDKTNAHDLLVKIAADPEKAVALTQMNSRQRIAELTRMQMSETKTTAQDAAPVPPPATKGVSKAPAPPPPVNASTKKEIDWRSDAASDEEFDRGFKENMAKRRAIR